MNFLRKRIIWRVLAVSTILVGFVAATPADDTAGTDYRCDQHWPGPGIVLRGVVLPLPVGYALIDRTASPHVFRNFVAVTGGGPPGDIHVGFAPDYEDRAFDANEIHRVRRTWKGIQRERLIHRPTGRELDFFWFQDGVMMEFSGAALPFSELVASCYLELLPMTVDLNQSSKR
jgi:hypothetical protein